MVVRVLTPSTLIALLLRPMLTVINKRFELLCDISRNIICLLAIAPPRQISDPSKLSDIVNLSDPRGEMQLGRLILAFGRSSVLTFAIHRGAE